MGTGNKFVMSYNIFKLVIFSCIFSNIFFFVRSDNHELYAREKEHIKNLLYCNHADKFLDITIKLSK